MNSTEAKKLLGKRAQGVLEQAKTLHAASGERNSSHTPEVLIMAYAGFAPRAEDFKGKPLEHIGERALLLWQREVAADFERLRHSALEYREVSIDGMTWVRDRMKAIAYAVLEEVRAQIDIEAPPDEGETDEGDDEGDDE